MPPYFLPYFLARFPASSHIAILINFPFLFSDLPFAPFLPILFNPCFTFGRGYHCEWGLRTWTFLSSLPLASTSKFEESSIKPRASAKYPGSLDPSIVLIIRPPVILPRPLPSTATRITARN